MGIPHVAGRDFTASDETDSLPVAIVSEMLVRRHFPGENPLGKRIHVSIGPPGGREYEIVGVVGDIKMTSLEEETRPAVYLPHTQLAIGPMTFVVRTDVAPLSLVPTVGRAVREIDAELPLGDVQTMEEVIDATLARPRVTTVLLTVFAFMALVMAAVGVYGVMAFSVSQRTREIGVRMALGATERLVFRLVVGSALRLVAIGVAAGVALAVALSRFLETVLYETPPLDPGTFAVTTAVLVAVAVLASFVPARRGTRVAPVEALRAE
jgi:putative ABC transport system permease protein